MQVGGLGAVWWAVVFAGAIPYSLVTDVHAFGAGTLAVFSLAGRIPDIYVVAWSTPYFVFDLYYCVLRSDHLFTLHHLFTLVGGAMANYSGYLRQQRASSYALSIELSTLPLNYWKRLPSSSARFFLLIVAYFLNRILFFGWVVWADGSQLSWSRVLKHTKEKERTVEYGFILLVRSFHFVLCIWFALLVFKGTA